MARIPLETMNKIKSHLYAGQVSPVFKIVRDFTIDKNADIPSLPKTIFATMNRDPDVVKGFTLGLADASSDVRLFCRKFVRYLENPAADILLGLVIETIDPFRPIPEYGTGLLGSFNGYASPVAAIILSEELLTARTDQSIFYSEAEKYVRDVILDIVSTLGKISFTHLVILMEYAYSLERNSDDMEALPKRPWSPITQDKRLRKPSMFFNDDVLHFIPKPFNQMFRKATQSFLAVLCHWARGELVVKTNRDETPLMQAIKDRFNQSGDTHTRVAIRKCRSFSAKMLKILPRQYRHPLYLALTEGIEKLPEDIPTEIRDNVNWYQNKNLLEK